jgi:hypothetical protein
MSVHGKNKKRRPGVHKHAASPETLRWNREQLLPERPPWMNVKTYAQLAKLRFEL